MLDQGYPRLEYAVQDGGSTDESVAVMGKYRDRLTHAESRNDNGQAHAINLGFFVVVPEDLVGPMQKQHHEDAMKFLRRLAIPSRSGDILEAWKRR